ncbi:MAG TPA: type II secretion system secretin GspD [Steroidobacteraceae bacterium]|jgi:general secretion pathway protein D|nr:type II secretion system secretin GspD [Steroidobacteraceae bacterium]
MMRASGLRARTAVAALRAALACVLVLCVGAAAAAEEPSTQRITPNFKDADITQIAEAVSAATGKNFIIDPRVRAQVTMLSSTPMSPDAFYQAFLSILQVHGFVALPAGRVIKIVPDANARQYPSNDLPDRVSSSSDEIVTQVIAVRNVNAAQLVPILRPLIPQYGHLAAYPASNILIISDRANNVNRIMRIIQKIDQVGDADVEIVPLQNASATEAVRVINALYQQQAANEGAALGFKVVADERSNSILLSGEKDTRLRIRVLIAHLDTPLQSGGDTQVRYLQNADAEKIAAKLKEQIAGAASGGAGGAPGAQTPAAQSERGTIIWADPQTNALIITATPKVMRNLMSVIDKLDIRRAQVLVEAIIVDVDLTKSASLGVNWAAYGAGNSNFPAGAFNSPVNGTSIGDIIELAASPTTALANGTSLPTGGIFGVGRIASNGLNFAAILSAVRSDSNSNVVATPSAITTDNQEATLKVATEVPFLTGQFTSTGASNSSVTPFQTIQREEVGTILKITPQINEGGAEVMLKIDLESSSVVPKNAGPEGAVDLTTTKRTVSTRVLIEDGGIVVLGGLTSADYSKQETRVPFLGAIPVIGQLFKVRSGSADRTDLMVFIRPKILRTDEQSQIETNTKYNYIREEQRKVTGEREWLPLLPGVKQPELPPMAAPPPSTAPAPTSAADKEKAGEAGRRARLAPQPPAGTPAPGAAAPAAPADASKPFVPTPDPPSTDTGHP